MLAPHPFQEDDIESFLGEPTQAGLNATGVGGGKTLIGTEIARRMDAKQTIIVAPVNTIDGWNRHMMLQRGMPVRRCGGTNKAWEQAMVDMTKGVGGAYFMSWEYARGKDFRDLRPDFVIMDEVHRAQNRETAQAKAYWSLTKGLFGEGGNPDARVIALSGTPAGNHMTGLWSVCRGLWPEHYPQKGEQGYVKGSEFGGFFWPWTTKYFEKVWSDHAGYDVPTVELNPGQIVKDIPYYVRHEQGVPCCAHHPEGMQADLPKRIYHDVVVELTATQKKLYKQMERDMIAWMEEHAWPIESGGLPMIQHMRLLQICLAVPTAEMQISLNGDSVEENLKVTFPLDTKSSKIDAVLDILEDAPDGEPFIVWTHSTALIPALVHRINARFRANGRHEAARWDGTVSHSERAKLKAAFGHGGPDVIVAQIAALAEGVDGLQFVCHNEIQVSVSADNTMNGQAAGRLERPGQEFAVNCWRILAENTVEDAKHERLSVKGQRLFDGLHA